MVFKKFKPFQSPKVLKFIDPDTQREFTDSTMQGLIAQIEGYRKANELETLEYLPQVIENYLCSLPMHLGMCTPLKNPKRSVVQWVKGGVALLKNIAYNSFAPQQEADRRSDICALCPHNQFPDKGFFIKWANQMAEASIGKLKSKNHDKLGICGICSCPLRSKVFYNGKIKLAKEELEQMKKIPCWQPEFAEKV